MGFEIRNNNSKEILSQVSSKITKGLEECGMMAEKFASNKLTAELNASPKSEWYKRTGALRNSIGHKVDASKHQMIIGAGEDYASYVEMGTGINYSGGRRTSWVYKGSDGKFHMTNGMKARPFIKPSIADHADVYNKILAENLK